MVFSTTNTKRLLPQVFDEKSKTDPHGIFAKVPMSSKTYKEGFRGITFFEMANAIAISRVYGGIHTRHAVEEGTKQGVKTAQNIDSKVKFRR